MIRPSTLVIALALVPTVSRAEPEPPVHAHGSHADGSATSHRRFDDVARWVEVFDDPERAAWQKPEELILALHIAPGDRVADIGAGTGYFSRHLSRAVGERGTVLVMDVEPNLVAHLRERAEREKTANVVPVLGSYDNPRLPAGLMDLVLVVDTFHHIDHRLIYFRRLQDSLSARGRLVVVDFHKRELPVGPPLDHKLSREQVIEEMAAAGYRLDTELDILPYQYALVFRLAAH